jgi:polyisoprenoid-binding protein YceI
MSPRIRNLIIGAVVLVFLGVVVAPYVYTHFIENPPPELGFGDLDSATTTTAADGGATGSPSGTAGGEYTVSGESQVGYRVSENLFGQDTEAVGRTTDVTGGITLDGTTVTDASFEVDMTTVASDRSQRDGQFRGRIMSTDEFPTATFELTEPIDLGDLPGEGDEVTVEATGDLTLRGVTKSVTFELTARLDGGDIQIDADIPLDFDQFDIPDASGGPAQVGRDGTLEVLLDLAPAS